MNKEMGKTIGAVATAAVLSVAALIGINAWDQSRVESIPAATEPAPVYYVGDPIEKPEPAPVPAVVEPVPVVEVPAPEPAPEPEPEPEPPSNTVSGTQVPWIPSSDPNNAAGGDWDMSVCQGGSASTGADGVPYCD